MWSAVDVEAGLEINQRTIAISFAGVVGDTFRTPLFCVRAVLLLSFMLCIEYFYRICYHRLIVLLCSTLSVLLSHSQSILYATTYLQLCIAALD